MHTLPLGVTTSRMTAASSLDGHNLKTIGATSCFFPTAVGVFPPSFHLDKNDYNPQNLNNLLYLLPRSSHFPKIVLLTLRYFTNQWYFSDGGLK